jgi:hypothetical protein
MINLVVGYVRMLLYSKNRLSRTNKDHGYTHIV